MYSRSIHSFFAYCSRYDLKIAFDQFSDASVAKFWHHLFARNLEN